jgi:hypothetical protein
MKLLLCAAFPYNFCKLLFPRLEPVTEMTAFTTARRLPFITFKITRIQIAFEAAVVLSSHK